jgi:hypothetical protein
VSRAEFAFLARPRATSRAIDSMHLFESRLLSLHGLLMMRQSGRKKMVNSEQVLKFNNSRRKGSYTASNHHKHYEQDNRSHQTES